MAKSSKVNESNVRAAMESAVSGLQSALSGVSTVLTQLQTGRRPAAEENRIHRAAGRETAERLRSDSDDDFESRPKKRYVYSRLVLMCKNDSYVGTSRLVFLKRASN